MISSRGTDRGARGGAGVGEGGSGEQALKPGSRRASTVMGGKVWVKAN